MAFERMSVMDHSTIEKHDDYSLVRLLSEDGTNRLTRACVLELIDGIDALRGRAKPIVLTGNSRFFSAGADLSEIRSLDGPSAVAFAKTGQALMRSIAHFPATVYAAIDGYCMGGGLDLALACPRRIASPHAIFGHRGATLGLMTGWGGTQRLPAIVGKGRALALLVAAEKLHAREALQAGLVDAIADDPVAEAARRIRERPRPTLAAGSL